MKRVDLVFRAEFEFRIKPANPCWGTGFGWGTNTKPVPQPQEFEFRIKPANPCWGTGFGWGTNTKPVPQPQVNPRLNPRVSDTRADPYLVYHLDPYPIDQVCLLNIWHGFQAALQMNFLCEGN